MTCTLTPEHGWERFERHEDLIRACSRVLPACLELSLPVGTKSCALVMTLSEDNERICGLYATIAPYNHDAIRAFAYELESLRNEFGLVVTKSMPDQPKRGVGSSVRKRAQASRRAAARRHIAQSVDSPPMEPSTLEVYARFDGDMQCGGCCFFARLKEPSLSSDWGSCMNPAAVWDGHIRFEHHGCLAHIRNTLGW